MKTIHRYLVREVLYWTVLVLVALLLLFSFFDLVYELGDLGKGNYRLLQIFLFILLKLPSHIYELFPVAALIGTLTALAMLAANSEVTVMRTSGLSMMQMARTLLLVGFVFALANFAFGEMVMPHSERLAQQFRLQALQDLVGQQFRSGLWVKDERKFVNIQEMRPDTSLRNLRIYEFDSDYKLQRIRTAKSGDYRGNKRWRITDVQDTIFEGGRVRLAKLAELDWVSELTPQILGVLLIKPEQMSVWNLFAYIEHLRENKQKATRFEIAQWSKFVYPLSILVMMVLALPFTAYQRRQGAIGGRILLGVMLGLAFNLISRLASHLGVINDWVPAIAAMAPAALFLALALAMGYAVERR